MFYKFNINGLYVGKSRSRVERSTNVAPPDENETAKWVWNHVNWVGLPLDWYYVEAIPNPSEPLVTPPSEETPPA